MADAVPKAETKPRGGNRVYKGPPRPHKPRAPPKENPTPNTPIPVSLGVPTMETKPATEPPTIPEAPAQEAVEGASKDSKPKRAPKRKGKGTKAAKAERDAAHLAIVLEAARTAVTTFAKAGVSCAAFGSLACRLYGAARCPKDVDLLVYQPPTEDEPWTAERLKKTLLDLDPVHFYLTMPKDPAASYRVLWYRRSYLGPGCKVDVLLPGTMHLPNLPPSSAVLISEIPLVPFSLLLLHKLQGWDDHRLAEEAHKKRKMPQDAGDIKRLLGMDERVAELVREEGRAWSDRMLFSEEFEELTRERVRVYCEAHPGHVKSWRELGFEVPDPVPKPEKEKEKSEEGGKVREGDEAPEEEEEEDEGTEADADADEDEDEARAEADEERLVAQLKGVAVAA